MNNFSFFGGGWWWVKKVEQRHSRAMELDKGAGQGLRRANKMGMGGGWQGTPRTEQNRARETLEG